MNKVGKSRLSQKTAGPIINALIPEVTLINATTEGETIDAPLAGILVVSGAGEGVENVTINLPEGDDGDSVEILLASAAVTIKVTTGNTLATGDTMASTLGALAKVIIAGGSAYLTGATA